MANTEDYLSDELETAVSKPKKSRLSPRPKSASKKARSSSAKGLPYKGGVSSGSISARELWLSAVKSGTTHGQTSKKGYQGKRTPVEFWTDTLRHTGIGHTPQTTRNMESFSGLQKSQTRNMSYGSTSHYLRQRVGTEKTSQGTPRQQQNGKAVPGTPAYKSREEYYDEVLALKKQIQALNNENSTQKSKMRRLEEDNIKKEKEIDQLLDPGKSEEMRRTLSDKRPDTSTVIHSMKQKVLKLEHQLKDKELSFNKLQSDLKTTKYEELKVQTEMLYREVVRLNQLKTVPNDSHLSKTAPVGGIKETPSRLKALQDTIKRMNEQNISLKGENKTLKEDLSKLMEDKATTKAKHSEYGDMSKKELLNSISKLEKRLDRAEGDTFSIVSDIEGRRGDTEGKIVLEGSVAQRLDQLDKRETELLEDISKQRNILKRLKEDRAHYRKKCDEKDKEIKFLKKDVEEMQAELDGFYDKDKSQTPRRTPRQASPKPKPRGRPSSASSHDQIRKVENFRENYAAKKIQKQWRNHQTDERNKQDKKIQDFTENRAARKIQSGWTNHKQQQMDAEMDDAAEMIQGAFRGHKSRQANLSRMRGYMAEPDEISMTGTVTVTESELEDAADTIQTNISGYNYRKKQMKTMTKTPSSESDLDLDTVINIQGTCRGHMARKKYINSHAKRSPVRGRSGYSQMSPTRRLDSEGEEEDEDDTPPASARRMSGRSTPSGRMTPKMQRQSLTRSSPPPSRGRTPPPSRGRTPPLSRGRTPPPSRRTPPPRHTPTPKRMDDSDDDSDDDIVVAPSRKGRLF